MMIPRDSYIVLSERLFEEQGQYVGICDELGLATCGKDFMEAERRLHNAIHMVLNKATEKGDIEALLREKGIDVRTPPTRQIHTFNQISLRSHEWLSPSVFPLGERQRVPV